MDIQYDKVCALLTDTIMLMCKNGIQFKSELKVQGLIGLTVDKQVFIIQINEVVKAEEQAPKKPQLADEPSFHGVNFTDSESTQENDAIGYYDSAFSCAGKTHKIQQDVSNNCRQPIELKKKVQKDFADEDLSMVAPSASIQIPLEDPSHVNVGEMETLQSNHSAFENYSKFTYSSEQSSPINLHVGSRLQVSESAEPVVEPPDIKPLSGELEEWIVESGMPPECIADDKSSCKKWMDGRKSEVLNLKASRKSSAANTSYNSLFKFASTRFNEKKRLAYDDYDQEECEVSKFSCNLCPAAYKHYCNLLTHEVKVHGREKKKGGRRKKLL